ncbi:carboxypeptidase family protein [Kordia periserrulae]|uniref:Carboxypeptidase family protein n=1 Tax=Kordia periserrulae TaxID=701523 RepID=A0A2T6C3N4_9FLAO|nr:carboxypeptidase-like regulatory domain-containing protein [Kordia periserrulae]PTX62930.1 carboxypeptidase family protein [Kordia periserrulae]
MNTSALYCSVTDTLGEPLPGVTLMLQNKSKSDSMPITHVTNAKGKSTFADLMPSEYEITVSMVGFQTIKRILTISVNRDLYESFVMQTAPVRE